MHQVSFRRIAVVTHYMMFEYRIIELQFSEVCLKLFCLLQCIWEIWTSLNSMLHSVQKIVTPCVRWGGLWRPTIYDTRGIVYTTLDSSGFSDTVSACFKSGLKGFESKYLITLSKVQYLWETMVIGTNNECLLYMLQQFNTFMLVNTDRME